MWFWFYCFLQNGSLCCVEESAIPITSLELLHDYNQITTTALMASTTSINHSNHSHNAAWIAPRLYSQVWRFLHIVKHVFWIYNCNIHFKKITIVSKHCNYRLNAKTCVSFRPVGKWRYVILVWKRENRLKKSDKCGWCSCFLNVWITNWFDVSLWWNNVYFIDLDFGLHNVHMYVCIKYTYAKT